MTLSWGDESRIKRIWDARTIARNGRANPLNVSDRELTDRLEELIKDAAHRRMIADVPVGAFLSSED